MDEEIHRNGLYLARLSPTVATVSAVADHPRCPGTATLPDDRSASPTSTRYGSPSRTPNPQLSDILDTTPGLRNAEDVFSYDPDVGDPDDEAAIQED